MAKVLDDLDLVEAAALPLVTITGNQLISIASGIQSAQTVLVSTALGSVGRAAIYTAKEKGVRVIAGVQKSQLAEAKGLNADQVVVLDDDAAFDAHRNGASMARIRRESAGMTVKPAYGTRCALIE